MADTAAPTNERVWLGPLIFALALIAAMALADVTRLGSATARDAGYPPINAVYLTDPARPLLDLAAIRARGVRVVTSAPELAGTPVPPDAIIVDAPLSEGVDAAWLGAQLRQGRYIVGINVPFSRLEQLPGYRQPRDPARFREDYGGSLFYSALYQYADAAGGQWVAQSDRIYSPEGFLVLLHGSIRSAQYSCPPTCPAPPRAR